MGGRTSCGAPVSQQSTTQVQGCTDATGAYETSDNSCFVWNQTKSDLCQALGRGIMSTTINLGACVIPGAGE